MGSIKNEGFVLASFARQMYSMLSRQFVLARFDSMMGKTHCLSLNSCPTGVREVEHEGFNPPRQNTHKGFHVPALMFGNPGSVGAILASAEKNRDFQGISFSNRPLLSNCFSYSLRSLWMVSASSEVLSSLNFAIRANLSANPDLYRGLF